MKSCKYFRTHTKKKFQQRLIFSASKNLLHAFFKKRVKKTKRAREIDNSRPWSIRAGAEASREDRIKQHTPDQTGFLNRGR